MLILLEIEQLQRFRPFCIFAAQMNDLDDVSVLKVMPFNTRRKSVWETALGTDTHLIVRMIPKQQFSNEKSYSHSHFISLFKCD